MSRPGRHQYIVKYQDHKQKVLDDEKKKQDAIIAAKAAKAAARSVKTHQLFSDNSETN